MERSRRRRKTTRRTKSRGRRKKTTTWLKIMNRTERKKAKDSFCSVRSVRSEPGPRNLDQPNQRREQWQAGIKSVSRAVASENQISTARDRKSTRLNSSHL